MVFYNVIPFIIMMTFNCLLIVNIRKSGCSQQHAKAIAKKRNLTISLLSVCVLFIVMTVPGTILFAYFYDSVLSTLGLQYIYIIDDISFLNHSILFFICFISNKKFRSTMIDLFYCRIRQQGNRLIRGSTFNSSESIRRWIKQVISIKYYMTNFLFWFI